MKHFVITIDGPCAAGKTSTAKALANRLGFEYMDTGLLFRTCAWYANQNGFDPKQYDTETIEKFMCDWEASGFIMKTDEEGTTRVYMHERDITDELRTETISNMASHIAAYSTVRKEMLRIERQIGNNKNIVVEGRDTGSVVFPDATLKTYLDATLETRAYRRMVQNPTEFENITEAILAIGQRDTRDKNRANAPLVIPEGATYIDNSRLNLKETIDLFYFLAKSNGALDAND